MIYLKKGQTLADNPGMVVYDPTGYYNDGDSIVCAPVFAPEEPACRYEAQYIAYGGMIYSVSNPDELMEQILKIDPETLFGKDSKQVALDKMVDQIVPQAKTPVGQETFGADEDSNSTTTPTAVLPENSPTPSPTPVATSTPPVSTPEVAPSPTPTPSPSPTPSPEASPSPTPVATSTPPVSTPEVTPSPSPSPSPTGPNNGSDNSTTTDEIIAFAKKKIVKKLFNI